MITLIDTSLWIDFLRARSPRSLKEFIAPYILDSSAHLVEPVIFEVLRGATDDERTPISRQFQTVPVLATPGDLWIRATDLGQKCRRAGHTAGALDLLIASMACFHQAIVVTFDEDFQKIAAVSDLKVKRLVRP